MLLSSLKQIKKVENNIRSSIEAWLVDESLGKTEHHPTRFVQCVFRLRMARHPGQPDVRDGFKRGCQLW